MINPEILWRSFMERFPSCPGTKSYCKVHLKNCNIKTYYFKIVVYDFNAKKRKVAAFRQKGMIYYNKGIHWFCMEKKKIYVEKNVALAMSSLVVRAVPSRSTALPLFLFRCHRNKKH